MNKTSGFFILNLWWLIPLAIIILFWQHAVPILLMLIFAYLGRIILNPVVKEAEKLLGSRKWSVFSIMLILIFSVQFQIFPTGGKDSLKSIVLPSIALGWFAAAALLRLTRSAMLEVLDSEYIKLARAKGVSNSIVVWKHAFRNALIAPVAMAALIFVAFLTGAVVTETVFAWPGIGRLAVTSVSSLDLAVLSGVVMILTSLYVIVNFITDLLYAVIDPRIRLT